MIMIPKRSQKWLIAKQEAFFWDPTNFNIPTSCVLHVEWKWSFSPAVPYLRFSHHRLPPNFRASPLGAPTCCARDWSSPALPHSQASWAWLCGSGRRNNGELRRAVGLRKSCALSFTTTFDSAFLRYWTQKYYWKSNDHVLTQRWLPDQFTQKLEDQAFKSPTTYTTSSLVSIISLTCGGLNKRDLVHFFIHPKKQKW